MSTREASVHNGHMYLLVVLLQSLLVLVHLFGKCIMKYSQCADRERFMVMWVCICRDTSDLIVHSEGSDSTLLGIHREPTVHLHTCTRCAVNGVSRSVAAATAAVANSSVWDGAGLLTVAIIIQRKPSIMAAARLALAFVGTIKNALDDIVHTSLWVPRDRVNQTRPAVNSMGYNRTRFACKRFGSVQFEPPVLFEQTVVLYHANR